MYKSNKLTFHIHDDPLRDGGRHAVGRDAEVGAHLRSADPRQVELLPFVDCHCNCTIYTVSLLQLVLQ